MIGADAIRGHIDLIVLAILEQSPSYAYAVAKSITDISDGNYTVKQTTLYTAMKRLEEAGALSSHQAASDTGKPRTYYSLTPEGRTLLEHKRLEWAHTVHLIDHFAPRTPQL